MGGKFFLRFQSETSVLTEFFGPSLDLDLVNSLQAHEYSTVALKCPVRLGQSTSFFVVDLDCLC